MNFPIYVEVGSKRTFAGALDWPGWSRSGRDETSALQALLDYAPRYAAAIRPARLRFEAPADIAAFAVLESLKGDSTTDFGAPGCIPAADAESVVDQAALHRLLKVLKACWQAFDSATAAARDKSLRSGPRGGGRDLEKIIEHVLGADQAYLSKLGGKVQVDTSLTLKSQMKECREAMLIGLEAASLGLTPARGPRGGLHWPPRYFVRRAAWHVLDHAWEIEDRAG